MIRLAGSALLLFASSVAMAIEEPAFDLLEKDQSVELRQYRPFIVAETFVDGNMDDASGAGFRLIADYIFGNNQVTTGKVPSSPDDKASTKIAMTAPVTMEPVAAAQKIAMTAPVTIAPQSADAGKINAATRWRIHFVMPSAYSLASLPKPNNPAVTLREVPGKRYAVLVFSGLAGEDKVREKTEALLGWAKGRNLKVVGTPQLARYNPPWTLPFLRRNEILVEIAAL